MDKYEIYQLFTATTKGEEQLESFNIRRQFVNTVGKNSGLEVDIPDKNRMDGGMAAKSLGYGVRLHSNLRAVVIVANK